jgi:beta-mannosidase
MHVVHRFGVKPILQSDTNELTIDFFAPVPFAEKQEFEQGMLPHMGGVPERHHPYNFVRKMACNFGWDWGPEVPTVGIWRPIRLEGWSRSRLAGVRPVVTLATPQRASVEVHVDVVGEPQPITIRLSGHGFEQEQIAEKSVQFDVPSPKLWWPSGHGGQPLYDLKVTLPSTGQTWHRRIGLRTSRLEITADEQPVGHPVPDARGEGMTLLINEKPIYCKGANWIPDDCFPHRITAERYLQRATLARDANMNMLRVWGGGIYEDEKFYDACDELGIMVWQDFMFACALYPEREPMWSSVEREARQQVTRLAAHPSVVLWNGGNECIMATDEWGPDWKAARESGEPWGIGYWLDLLPRVVGELAPTTPYWPNSPYSGTLERYSNANEFGNRHMWDVWHGDGQYRNYLGHYPRMATEFGYHAPPTWPTIERSVPADQRHWDSPVMRLHNKNPLPGQQQTHERIADDFVPPEDDFDAWLYLAQIMQARALSMGIEWFRCLHPWNQASLYWQFNDCWPVSSWSAVDGDGRRKPLWYASRRFFADRLVTIKPSRVTTPARANDALNVYLHNDHDEPWTGPCRLRRVHLTSATLDEHVRHVEVAPRSLAKFGIPSNMLDRSDAALVAELPETSPASRGWWWFARDKELDYPRPTFDHKLRTNGSRQVLQLTARTLLRDLGLFADRLDPQALVSEQQITLLPGDTANITIDRCGPLDEQRLVSPPVLQVANHFGRRPGRR